MKDSIIQAIKTIVGSQNTFATPEERWGYAYDATDRAAMPEAAVFPGSAAEVAAIVRLAHEHRFPVVPRGAGTGHSGGSVPIEGGVVLVLTRLNRILEISRPEPQPDGPRPPDHRPPRVLQFGGTGYVVII